MIVKLSPPEDPRPESVISEKVKVTMNEEEGHDEKVPLVTGPGDLNLVGSFCLKGSPPLAEQYRLVFIRYNLYL